MRFYLVVNLDKANAADCAAEAAAELLRCGAEVLLTPGAECGAELLRCQVLTNGKPCKAVMPSSASAATAP